MAMSRRLYGALTAVFVILLLYCIYTQVDENLISGFSPGPRNVHWKTTFNESMRQKVANDQPHVGEHTYPSGLHNAIMVIGDSHIYYLEKNIIEHNITGAKLDFNTGKTVRIFGISGARVDTLRFSTVLQSLLLKVQPYLVFLHIGGNDADWPREENVISGNIVKYMNELKTGFNVSKVILSEQFHRTEIRHISTEAYNMKIIEINKQLMTDRRNLFWRHTELMQAKKDILSNDGIHLNRYGQALFYKSIKAALEKAIASD